MLLVLRSCAVTSVSQNRHSCASITCQIVECDIEKGWTWKKLVSRAAKNTAIVHIVRKSECYIQSQSTAVLYASLTDVAYIPCHFCERKVLKLVHL